MRKSRVLLDRGRTQGVGPVTAGGPPATAPLRLRAWQRLSVRTVGLLVGLTLLAIGLVGTLIYQHQKRELQATLGTLLVSIARTGALLVDPALHAEVSARSGRTRAPTGACARRWPRFRMRTASKRRSTRSPTSISCRDGLDSWSPAEDRVCRGSSTRWSPRSSPLHLHPPYRGVRGLGGRGLEEGLDVRQPGRHEEQPDQFPALGCATCRVTGCSSL